MQHLPDLYPQVRSALSQVRSGSRVFVHGAAATPTVLLAGLVERASSLRDVELIHLHTEGSAPYAEEALKQSFRVANLFVGSNIRHQMDGARVDYLPCNLFDIPRLFRSGKRPIDVALLHLSPPDERGQCSLGTSVDVARAAFQSAPVVIAQINRQMPRTHGDTLIPMSEIDHFIEVDEPLPICSVSRSAHPEHAQIGKRVSELIQDGACLQVGIGSIPDAVLAELGGHRHLGLHTEMWSDGALELIRRGVIDNSKKANHPGHTVSSFLMGSQELYRFVDDNRQVLQLPADYVNHPSVIAENSDVVSINSAVEIDLTGQVCADSVGPRVISGSGGQLDFVLGAHLSSHGKSIFALTSRTAHGQSRIVSALKSGAGVVTPRASVQWIVTEYGAADLFGLTLHERARALIQIAHPDDRALLEKALREGNPGPKVIP